jgi:hypothetical protein
MYSSPNIVWVINPRKMSWTGNVALMGESRGVYSVLAEKPEGKRSLGRRRSLWKYNIKMVLQDVGYEGMYWIDAAQERDKWRAPKNSVMNFRVP